MLNCDATSKELNVPLRFQEKVAVGRLARFAIFFGDHSLYSATIAASQLGVRDVFYYSNRVYPSRRLTLSYLDYESLDIGVLRTRGYCELLQNILGPEVRTEVNLPYRLGPLAFAQVFEKSLYDARYDRGIITEMIRSVADWRAHVVFFPDFSPATLVGRVGPRSEVEVLEFRSSHTNWAPKSAFLKEGVVNLVSPGNTRCYQFCVCELLRNEVVWHRYPAGP